MEAVLEKNQTVVLHNVSWNSYRQITDALQNETSAHFTFDRGLLEIMVFSLKHENLKKILAMLFERLAELLEIEIFAAGSTTFQREDLAKGFEPNECYYIRNSSLMRGKESVNLSFDPPPDLTIEVDIKHSSLNRVGIFAAIGIPEVWRYDGRNLTLYLLEGGSYRESAESSALPKVTVGELSRLIETGKTAAHREFLSEIKNYTEKLKVKDL